MATIFSKVSTQVAGQQPDFVQADHPDFLQFLKAYYEFMESAELKLNALASQDAILYEEGSTTYITQENVNRYRESNDTILLEDYDAVGSEAARINGAFINGETIVGSTSKATATVRVEDITANSRLFISSQNKFLIGEQVVGQTSRASGNIAAYTANPVQNVMQLLDYMDVDNTIDSFFTEFKEAFMRTIPDNLTTGLDKRKLLKSIKDLYRAKGTKKGHQLFFRILLNEEAELSYPTKNMLRVSDGQWSDDTILRVYAINSTILMEDAGAATGEIFILMEDGAQILTEDSEAGLDNLVNMVGQTITQNAVVDLSILDGGAYYNMGYSIINKATAVIDSIFQYGLSGETVTEFILNPGSVDGTFATGHNVSATDNTDSNITLDAKIMSIIDKADTTSTAFQSSQYFATTDGISVSADTGNDGQVSILNTTSGQIGSIIVDSPGSGYEIGDALVVDNANTNGVNLKGEISVVNGGIAPETGTLTSNFRIDLEPDTPGAPGDIILESSLMTYETPTGVFQIGETLTGLTSKATATVIEIELDTKTITYNALSGSFTLGETLSGGTSGFKATLVTNTVVDYLANEEDLGMVADNRFILEGATTETDSYVGSVIVQESGTGNGDITDVRVTGRGYGYTSLPTMTITSSSGTLGTVRAKGTGVGVIDAVDIINQGAHYTDQESLKFLTTTNFLCTLISGTFTLNETVTGGTSGATARFRSQTDDIGIIRMDQLSTTPFIPGETITGGASTKTAVINSFTKTNIPGLNGTKVDRTGRFVNQDGFISDSAMKIQDDYYYQDYSYVVKTASSIVDWRDDLLGTVHPAGWAVFGQVDIASQLVQLANITSVIGLGPAYGLVWNALMGMRLGTVDQVPINPTPTDEANEPAGKANLYNPAMRVATGTAYAVGDTLTGNTSGATGKVTIDETSEASVRIITYVPLTGIFAANETITNESITTTVVEVYGLRGVRDRTLYQRIHIDYQNEAYGNLSGARPNLQTIELSMFRPSMVASAASSLTFTPNSSGASAIPVYVTQIQFTTLATTINDSAVTISLTDASSYPTSGTIQIGDELIDYTGKSTNDLTGCTRGQHSTAAAGHSSGVYVGSVRWAQRQYLVTGYRVMDMATDENGTSLTFGDFASYPNRHNNISPPSEVTLYKT